MTLERFQVGFGIVQGKSSYPAECTLLPEPTNRMVKKFVSSKIVNCWLLPVPTKLTSLMDIHPFCRSMASCNLGHNKILENFQVPIEHTILWISAWTSNAPASLFAPCWLLYSTIERRTSVQAEAGPSCDLQKRTKLWSYSALWWIQNETIVPCDNMNYHVLLLHHDWSF